MDVKEKEAQRVSQLAEFKKGFLVEDCYAKLRKTAMQGLRKSELRSAYWKVSLQFVNPRDRALWPQDLAKQRTRYEELRGTHITKPDTSGDVNVNNPLSLHANSKWQGYFKDKELTDVIDNDLKRTHPTNDFFVERRNQIAMRNVLFIWAKLHPELGYKQGMNELISPIMLSVAREAREKGEGKCEQEEELLDMLLDAAFVEHDVFALFETVMVMQHWYFLAVDPDAPPPPVQDDNPLVAKTPQVQRESPLAARCGVVFHQLLRQVDAELYHHLVDECCVMPNVFLLRWLRLMFTREFHILDTMVLWDAIFASVQHPLDARKGFTLLEDICVSMILYVRAQLLEGDETFAMTRLMKFPPIEDVRVILIRALFLRDPKQGLLGNHSLDYNNTPGKTTPITRPVGGPDAAASTVPQGKGPNSLFKALFKKKKKPNQPVMVVSEPLILSSSPPPHSSSSSSAAAADQDGGEAESRMRSISQTLQDAIATHNPFRSRGSSSAEPEHVPERGALAMHERTLLGAAVGHVVRKLRSAVVDSEQDAQTDSGVVLEAIAELKHLQDVISGRLAISDLNPETLEMQ